jgi:hypothetical protein
MPDDEHTSMAFASLVLRGKYLIPQEVTNSIGIIPTKSFKRGDIRKGSTTWPHGYWELTSKESVQSSDLSKHLEWLAEVLEPTKKELIKILNQEGINAEISCFWILPSSHESLSISSEMVRRMAFLGVKINVEIYSQD